MQQYQRLQKTLLALFFFITLGAFLSPVHITHAEDPVAPEKLVPCEGTEDDPCTYADLLELAENILQWLVFISVFVAAAAFVYAGFVYVTAGGSEDKIKQAHNIFRNVIIGFLITLGAWLLVYTIVNAVIDEDKFNEEALPLPLESQV